MVGIKTALKSFSAKTWEKHIHLEHLVVDGWSC